MSINSGEITMQLSHPLTEEQWDIITDVDLEHTNSVWFHTKHGKDVEFVKVVRCKECKYFNPHVMECEGIGKWFGLEGEWGANDYCSKAERKDDE